MPESDSSQRLMPVAPQYACRVQIVLQATMFDKHRRNKHSPRQGGRICFPHRRRRLVKGGEEGAKKRYGGGGQLGLQVKICLLGAGSSKLLHSELPPFHNRFLASP